MLALILIIICAIIAAIAFLVILLDPDRDTKAAAKWYLGLPLPIIVILFFVGSVIVVPTQNIAIMTLFGRVTGQVFDNGMHFKSLLATPVNMSLKTQLFQDDTTSASKDLQDVTATIAINYHLDESQAPSTYRTIGRDYINVIGNPILQETVKEITAKYNAEEMITNREQVKADITSALVSRLHDRGVVCESVNITNFKFSVVFESAIEAKVAAAQAIQTEQNNLLTIQVKAQEAKAQADGEANAAIARAKGQAEANAIITASLNDRILQYYFIDKMGDKVQVWVVPSGQAFTITPTP